MLLAEREWRQAFLFGGAPRQFFAALEKWLASEQRVGGLQLDHSAEEARVRLRSLVPAQLDSPILAVISATCQSQIARGAGFVATMTGQRAKSLRRPNSESCRRLRQSGFDFFTGRGKRCPDHRRGPAMSRAERSNSRRRNHPNSLRRFQLSSAGQVAHRRLQHANASRAARHRLPHEWCGSAREQKNFAKKAGFLRMAVE